MSQLQFLAHFLLVCSRHLELNSAPALSPQAMYNILCPPSFSIIFCPHNHFLLPHIHLIPPHPSRFSMEVTCRKASFATSKLKLKNAHGTLCLPIL